MPKTTDKREFKVLSDELAVAEELDFQRKILPLLRVIFPVTVEAPRRRSIDKSGIDLLVWTENGRFPLVVQTKGFSVREAEVGPAQAKQFVDSITAFRSSGLSAETYLLIHNRDNRNPDFRRPVEDALQALRNSGQATRAELWPRQRLLSEAFNAMLQLLKRSIREKNLSVADLQKRLDTAVAAPLEIVPYSRSKLIVDQHQLRSISAPQFCLDDPVNDVKPQWGFRFTILIGEFGLGKTTTVGRAVVAPDATILYVPAAMISNDTMGAKDLAAQCIDIQELLADYSPEDRPVLQKIARAPIEYLLKDPQSGITIIFDGLDESAFLTKRGGLQWFTNFLYQLRASVILTARTEFWRMRQADFASAFGDPGKSGHRRTMHAMLIELLPWEPKQMVALVRRYATSIKSQAQRKRFDKLAVLIENGEFTTYYGDIPQRPLFLRLILECVASMGVHKVGRARLLEEWATLKITRDLRNPAVFGGKGRVPILTDDDGLGATLQLAFRAMELAAIKMTLVSPLGGVALESSCPLQDILAAYPALSRITDPTGLVLNSLLLPVSGWNNRDAPRVKFAHRAFQEYFLSRSEVRNPGIPDETLPDEIQKWIADIKREGLFAENSSASSAGKV